MSSPHGSQSPVAEFLAAVRTVQFHLPQQHRAHFTGFWNNVRNRIADLGARLNTQVRENGNLVTQNSALQVQISNLQQAHARARSSLPASASRPPTSGSGAQSRADLGLKSRMCLTRQASNTIEHIRGLPVQLVRTRLGIHATLPPSQVAKWSALKVVG